MIHTDQKGFINGRIIGENTRLIFDIINKHSASDLHELIVLINFEKAFDSLSWEFILKVLGLFYFIEKVISWVRSLQSNSTSKILQNGNLSETIHPGRGCRQGDLIYPYLFVLAAEFLAEAIRTNKKIEVLTMSKQEHKISLHVDDTTQKNLS